MVDPDYDIYGSGLETDEENDPSITRPISGKNWPRSRDGAEAQRGRSSKEEVEPEEDETEEPEDFRMKMNMRKNLSQNSLRTKREL